MSQINGIDNILDGLRANLLLDLDDRIEVAKTDIAKLLNPPAPTASIYDDFKGTVRPFDPNLWELGYHGQNPTNSSDVGKVGVIDTTPADPRFPQVMQEYPYLLENPTPPWPSPNCKTAASLILTTKLWKDLDVTHYARTIRSLRKTITGTTQKPSRWEVYWFMWHFNKAGYKITDKGAHFHHRYIILRNDGTLELGRKDNEIMAEHQYTIATTPVNSFSFKYGVFNKLRVKQVGDHITIWVDDKQLIDVTDDGTVGTPATDTKMGPVPHPPSATLRAGGQCAHYNEDAQVQATPLIFAN